MSGVHHAYNRLGRQDKGARYNPFKRGPRQPHLHKASHGYWQRNEAATGKGDRYIWVHSEGYETPFVPTPFVDRPFWNDALDVINGLVAQNGNSFPPPVQTTQNAGMTIPLLVLAAVLLMK